MVYNPSKARPGGGGGAGGGGRGARNTAARKAVAKNTKKAESDLARARRIRKSDKTITAKINTRDRQKVSKQVRQEMKIDKRRDEYRGVPPQEKGALKERVTKGVERGLKVRSETRRRGGDSSAGLSATTTRRASDALQKVKKARTTERKVNRLTKLSDHIAKRSGGGRRTHFLSDNPS